MQKVESFSSEVPSTDSIPYLDANTLVEGAFGKALAYVSNATSALAKTNTGFMTFYLKDVNANIIAARLFDVKDFAVSGLAASAYKHKPVIVNYIVQTFAGKKSLIIDGAKGIEIYQGEFDYKSFVGSFESDSTLFRSVAAKVLPEEVFEFNAYSTASFDSVGEGRTGAFMKVCNVALASLSEYQSVPGLDFQELMRLFFLGTKYYFEMLKLESTYDNFSFFKISNLIQSVVSRYNGDEVCMPLVELLQVLAKQTKPRSLYCHLIDRALSNAAWSLNLILFSNTLPVGAKATFGGVDLLKY